MCIVSVGPGDWQISRCEYQTCDINLGHPTIFESMEGQILYRRFIVAAFVFISALHGCDPAPESVSPSGYFADANSGKVKFVFDKGLYSRVTADDSPIWIDLDQINIRTVSVVGDMNNWHKTSLTMTEEPNGNYELIYPTDHLNPDSSYAFKFLINDYYWVEPNGETPNRQETLYNHRQNKSFNFTLKL